MKEKATLSKGDIAAIVQLPQGSVLLAGDAVVHFDWLNAQDVQKIVQDQQKAAEMRNQVRALQKAEPRVAIIPGHDLSAVPNNRPDVILHHQQLFRPEAWLNNSHLSAQLAQKILPLNKE